MKKIYIREIRHIIANYSLRNKATGYCYKSKSVIFKIIRNLVKHNWIECINIDGLFLFVIPSKTLIVSFGKFEIENKKSNVPALHRKMIWTNHEQNSYNKIPEIIAA
jgi:hypothetical protein